MNRILHRGESETDWSHIRERLARAAGALQDSAGASTARNAGIMAARARKLAQPLKNEESGGKQLDVVVLLLGKERIAIEAHYVRAVSLFADVTPIPGTPEFVMGLTNFRGEIVPVFDIRELFNGASRNHDQSSRILFLGRQEPEFGIVADEVLETTRVPAADLRQRPWRREGTEAQNAGGVTRDALNVLDGRTLLDDARFFIGETRTATQA